MPLTIITNYYDLILYHTNELINVDVCICVVYKNQSTCPLGWMESKPKLD